MCNDGRFLSFLHPIHHAKRLAIALKLTFGTVQIVAYFDIGTFVFRIGALEHLLQAG